MPLPAVTESVRLCEAVEVDAVGPVPEQTWRSSTDRSGPVICCSCDSYFKTARQARNASRRNARTRTKAER